MELSCAIKMNTNGPEGFRGWHEAIKTTVDGGFKVLDLQFDVPMMMAGDYRAFISDCVEYAQKLGARFRYAHLPYYYPNPNDTEAVERFNEAMRRAISMVPELGAECAAIHPWSMPEPNYDEERLHRRTVEYLKPLAELCANAGFDMCLEIMCRRVLVPQRRYCETTTTLLRVAEDVDCSVCWDTGHGRLCGLDQYAAIKQIGKRLKLVHINDNDGLDDIHIPPFSGNINWKAVTSGLRDIDFKGDMNFEIDGDRIPESLRPSFNRYIADIGRTLIKMVECHN